MPTSPLPNLAGGRPPPAASALGTRVPSSAPPLTAAPPAIADLRRNDARVSPLGRPSSAASWASATAPSGVISLRLIEWLMAISPRSSEDGWMSGSLSNSPNDLLPTYSQRSRQRINRDTGRRVSPAMQAFVSAPRRARVQRTCENRANEHFPPLLGPLRRHDRATRRRGPDPDRSVGRGADPAGERRSAPGRH